MKVDVTYDPSADAIVITEPDTCTHESACNCPEPQEIRFPFAEIPEVRKAFGECATLRRFLRLMHPRRSHAKVMSLAMRRAALRPFKGA